MVGYPVRDYKIIVTITRHGVLKPTSERLHEIEIDPFSGGLGGTTGSASDSRSEGRGFDSH